MATETATARVELDGQSAQNQLSELKDRARDLRKELTELRLKKDPGYEAKKREFDSLQKSIKDTTKSTFDLNNVMKNLSGASLKELTRAQRTLNAELRGMNRSTAEGKKAFAEKSQQLQRVQAEIARTTSQMKGFRNQGGMMNKTLGQLKLGYLAVAGAVAGVFAGVNRLMKAYDTRAKANETLLFALQGQEQVQRRLIGLANQMQSALGIDDDVLKEQMTFLSVQGRSEIQIKNTMKAAAELSKVMGIGLQQAVMYLDATFENNIGRLGRLDSGFTKLTEEQLRNGAAVDLINQKYGGLAQKSFEQGLGPLRRFQNAWGDLQKTLGGFLVNALMPVFNGLSRGMDNLNVVFDRFTTTANQRFSDQIQKVADLETGIRPLLTRYDELATKSNLSTLEQEELSRIIDQVSKALPSAATRFDEYGRAIEISTDRVAEFIDQQRAMLQYENRGAIKEVTKDIEKVNKQLSEIGPDIEAIQQTGTFQLFRRYFNQQTQEWTEGWRDASSQQVQETIETNQRLLFERSGMIARLEELDGSALEKEIERRRQEAEEKKNASNVNVETTKQAIDDVYKYEQQAIESRIALMKDGYEKDLTLLRFNFDKQRQAIESELLNNNKLTIEAKESLNQTLINLAEKQIQDEQSLRERYLMQDINFERQILGLKIELAASGSEEQLELRYQLLEKQREMELAQLAGTEEQKAELRRAINELYDGREIELHTQNTFDKLNQSYELEQMLLMTQRTQGIISKQAYDQRLKELEVAHLITMLELRRKLGLDTIEVERRLNEMRILEQDNANQRLAANQQKLTQNLLEFSEIASEGVRDYVAGNENALYVAGKRMILFALNLLKQQAQLAIAGATIQSLIQPDSILTFGATGLVRAAILVGLIEAAFAVAEGVVSKALTPPSTKQFFRGRYNVTGAEDGRNYNVPFMGPAKTGIYETPALISERGPELIIDAPTTRNIRLNHPEIITAIHQARVPQYAQGRLPETQITQSGQVPSSPNEKIIIGAIDRLNITVANLNTRLNEGIEATLSYQVFKKFETKADKIENTSNL